MAITQILFDSNKIKAIQAGDSRPVVANGCVWLDINSPTEDDLRWVEEKYQFHPLTIEDCRNFNQRAKVVAYGDYLFLSLTTTARRDGELVPQEMEAYLGRDYLITIHREPLAAIESARKVAANTRSDFILYFIADHMVDAYFALLDEIDDEIDALEDQILENATQATMQRIFQLIQQLVFLRKITAPMREVMNALAGTRFGLVDEQTAIYF